MKTINIVGALMLVILITSIPLSHTVIAASSPQLTVYTYNILEVPVDVGGLVFKGSLKMFNETVRIYIEGSLDSNHTLEGFIDLKFKRVYENRTFKANLTLNAAIANVSSRDLNFTLNADIYWEAFESEGRLVSYSVIAANYTLFGALPESLTLKSLRIESTSTLVFLTAKNVSRLTVESILKPRSGMPEVDRMLTLMLATIINETLRNVKADLEKIPGVTFEYKIEVKPREAQLNIRINLLFERGLPREVFKILAPGIVEKEGYANIKLKPGTVEFKVNTTFKLQKPIKKYFETTIETGKQKLQITLAANKTLDKTGDLEAVKILESLIRTALTLTELQEQLTLTATIAQETLKSIERTLANLEKQLPTQYQIPAPPTTSGQTTTLVTMKTETMETPKTLEREERKVNIPLIMALLGALTLALIAIAYRLLSGKALIGG